MMSALTEGISRLHVLHILHRDVFSVMLVTPANLVATSVVCHSFFVSRESTTADVLSGKIQEQVKMTAQQHITTIAR